RNKKYRYFDQLQFLLKIFERDDSESTLCDNNTETQQSENDESSTSTLSSEVLNPSLGPRFSCARKRSRIPPTDETDKAILIALEAASQPPPPQEIIEDTAFCNIFGKKLYRRLLTLIKQIKGKRYER
ncbi:unnamed protein product, partial [Tenebrio molitor]